MTNLNILSIKEKIFTIRGMQVMLDSDLAILYNVKTKALNQAIKRNKDRFPKNFMFQLTPIEYDCLRSQNVTLKRGEHRKYIPYVFTEQGVAMLSGVLKSKIAVQVSIQIINAFVEMRHFIIDNAQIFTRLGKVELKQIEYGNKFEQVFNAIENKSIKPEKGIFYDGQVFDSYVFISKLIRSANSSIILIDNYVDDSVLTLLNKRKNGVGVKLYSKNNKKLNLDIKKYNSQYAPIEYFDFNKAHDRFLIIDDSIVYHFGASLKDLGKKWFAFSRFDKGIFSIFDRLGEIK